MAEGAQIITWKGPNRFICWNCCALRFESEEEEAICPNCGHTAARIPIDITFALDRIEVAESEGGGVMGFGMYYHLAKGL